LKILPDPANSESRLYYNTTIKKVKYFNGQFGFTVVDDLDTRLTNSRTYHFSRVATNLALGLSILFQALLQNGS
jgi:hypothetical protein